MSASNGNNEGPKTVSVPQTAGTIERREFGATQLQTIAETASSALASQAEAAVKARFAMAIGRPRDIDVVRLRILAACKRPFFAKGAVYAKPVGKKLNKQTGKWEEQFAEGLSIRFAEEAIRNLGNAMTESVTIYDDPKKRIVRVAATDLETNVVHYKDIIIEKTVERRNLKAGQLSIATRMNSYGDLVHIVEATDDDLATKAGALGAKALRDKILMLIPSDIQEEAKELIWRTQADEDAKDPEASRKAMIDSFAEIGVMPNQIVEFLGHELAALQPAELQRLRAIFAAIRDGESTWSDVIEQTRDTVSRVSSEAGKAAAPGAPTTVTPGPQAKKSVNDLAADAKAKREAASKTVAAGPAQQTLATPAPKPVDDPDAADRAAAAPRPDEFGAKAPPRGMPKVDDDPMPAWDGGPGKPRGDDGTGIR